MSKNQNHYLEELILHQSKLIDANGLKADSRSIYPNVTIEFQYPPPNFESENYDLETANCIYYIWWKYLRVNKDYLAYYKNGVVPSDEQKKVFDDFGNIYESSFQVWWETYHMGTKLFFGITRKDKLALVPTYDLVDPDDFERNIIYLRLPLSSYTKRELQQWFNKFLKNFHKGKRGHRKVQTLQNTYLVVGRSKPISLNLHLEIYEYREANPKLALWRIARHFKLFHLEQYAKPTPDTQARNIMSATVSRHLKKANALIHNVGFGRFPDYSRS